MKIKSVSCRQFAGLRNLKPVVFEDGLNIICGPNESGKSTLVGLIYSLLWQSCKVGKRSTEDKAYRTFYFPAEVKQGSRANTIDGKLTIEGEDGQYTISKKWADAGNGEIETPTAVFDEIADAKSYLECQKTLLKYGEGVYKEAIFANQKTIDSVLQALLDGKLKSDLSAVASSALLDMGGISSEKFLTAIDNKLKELDNSWDFKTNGPSKGRGIDNKITRNVGKILAAYYQLEDNKKRLSELEAKVRAVGMADKNYTKALSAYNNAQDVYDKFDKFYGLLVNYKNNVQLKSNAEDELDRREKARDKWPKLISSFDEAKNLEEELVRAETILLWTHVQEILIDDEKAKTALESLIEINDDDVRRATELEKDLRIIENKLKSFSALISFTLANGYELIVTSELDGHRINTNSNDIELSEAVKIEIPGVAEFHISSVNLDVEQATTDLHSKRTKLMSLLEKYNVNTVEELLQLQREISKQKDKLELERKGYSEDLRKILNGKEQNTVKKEYEAAICLPTREKTVIEKDIKAITDKPIGTFIVLTEQKIDNYIKEFESEDANNTQISELERNITTYDKKLSSAEQIPDEFKSIKDPDNMKLQLSSIVGSKMEAKDNAYTNLTNARVAIKVIEEADDYMTPEELAEVVEENESQLTQLKEEHKAWQEIKTVAENILNATGDNPLKAFEDDFRNYLSILSEDGITLDALDKKMKADIYSGNNRMTFDLLSEGTKDTISLAFRLAVIKYLFPDGGGLAFFDDPFTDMDIDRRARACGLLKDFAKNNQVIFVTCDPSYIDVLGGNVINFERAM